MKKTAPPRPDLIDHLRSDWQAERPDLDTSAMDIVGRILLLSEALKKSASVTLRPFDIGYTDLDVLATLRRSGAPYRLRPADLLGTVLIQSGSLTACLDRLEKRSLVKRTQTEADRRSRSVQLTEKGKTLIDRAIEARFAEAAGVVEGLSQPEAEGMASLLRKLLANNTTEETR